MNHAVARVPTPGNLQVEHRPGARGGCGRYLPQSRWDSSRCWVWPFTLRNNPTSTGTSPFRTRFKESRGSGSRICSEASAWRTTTCCQGRAFSLPAPESCSWLFAHGGRRRCSSELLWSRPDRGLGGELVKRPRPSTELIQLRIDPQEIEGFPSFPSGHTVHYTVFFGFLAFLAATRLKPPAGRSWLLLFVLAPVRC